MIRRRLSLGTVANCLIFLEYLLLWSINPSSSLEDGSTLQISSQNGKLVQEARKLTNNAKSNKILYDYNDDCFDRIRLPNHVTPQQYSVAIEPDLDKFTFKSAISIDVDVNLEKIRDADKGMNLNNKILLHSNGLNILDAWYLTETGEKVAVTKVCESRKFEVIRLDLRSNLANGKGKILINYSGQIRNDMKGFYRSEYRNSSGETRYHAVTQFQATGARRALPCFDEPAFKATFDITLIVPKDRLALANTHIILEEDLGDKKAVMFATTPIMSTYLVAFVVGEFDYVEGVNRERPIRVYTSPGKGELGRFALSVAIRCLPFLENYFTIKFPLQKLDLVTLPDFSERVGGNWGLVTYSESQLLIDVINTSLSYKVSVTKAIAQKLAYQWFGNLVTMFWWNDLWLIEGFATFMQYFVSSRLYPELKIMDQFVFESHDTAMSADAKRSTRPLALRANESEEIDALIDRISYNKAASIVSLLRNHLSDGVFHAGLQHYITRFAYKNTEINDFWDSMEFISGRPIKEMMQSWTNQAGYPCLEVSISKKFVNFLQNKHTIRLSVSQSKFTDDGQMESVDTSRWIVPISLIAGDENSIQNSVLSDKKTKIVVNDHHGDWIKLNANFGGFYVVYYSKQLRQALYPAIRSKELSATDRYNLLADANRLTMANKLSVRELLQMTDYYRDEDSGPVAEKLVDVYLNILGFIKSTSLRDKYKQFGRELFKSLYTSYGWDEAPFEAYTTSIARPRILMTCLINQYKPAIQEGLRRFKLILRNEQQLDPSIKGVIFYTVAQFGDDYHFDRLFELYRKTDSKETQQLVAHALSNVEESSRVSLVIEWILTSADVRDGDRHRYLISMAASNVGRQILWDMINDNLGRFLNLFDKDIFLLIIKVVGSSLIKSLSEEKSYRKVDMFFMKHHFEIKAYETVLSSIISEIVSHVKYEKLVSESTEQFLLEYQDKGQESTNN